MREPKRSSRSKPQARFLWVIDPWATLDAKNDTTLLLARTASEMGYVSHVAEVSELKLESSPRGVRIFAPCSTDDLRADGAKRNSDLSAYTQIHYRVDPPVDAHYTDPLKLLLSAGLPIVNSAATLLGQSEKLLAIETPGLAPTSAVVQSRSALDTLRMTPQFRERSLVLKPLSTAQSIGVSRLDPSSPTPEIAQPMLVQHYLLEILSQGELRTWWVDSQCIGALWKHPPTGEFRVLIDQGSRLTPAPQIPPKVRAKFPQVRRLLKRHGVRMAAVDWIGPYVSDFNFTSPGLLPQLQELMQVPVARKVISLLAKPR